MKRRIKLTLTLLATALWLCFIFSRSAQTAAVSDAESGWVLSLLRRILPAMSMLFVRKLAHFSEFFLLGALLWLDWRLLTRGNVLLPLGVGLLCSAADEYLQTFIPGRSGELMDVLLDFSGVCCAVLLLQLQRRRKRSP